MSTVVGPLICRDTNEVLAEHVEVADTYWSRLAGLQFRRQLHKRHALLIVPSASIHTGFMRFPIDVVFLDSTGTVTGIHCRLVPWRVAAARGARAVLELPAGAAERLEVGMVIQFTQPIDRRSVTFLSPANGADPSRKCNSIANVASAHLALEFT